MNKTVHLTNAYHASSGGIRTFYHALLDAADRHRREVRLVVPGEQTRVEEVNRWARIYHVAAPQSAFVDQRYRLILPHRYLARRGLIWRILYDERPDLIEVCDKYSLVYLGGLIRGRWMTGRQRPAVTALTCERMDDSIATFLSSHAVAQRFSRWYMRHVYVPQFDAHVAVSRYTADELCPDVRPVTVAPMGLDLAAFGTARRTAAARSALFGAAGRDPRAVLLLYVGRLSVEKQLPLLLQVMALLPPPDGARVFHLALAGEGPLRDWLEREGQRVAPGRVHLLGHLDRRADLARCYANADLLVHPNFREPFGLAPIEAMASGLPVVLPRAGGVIEYATDANAWLASPTAGAMAEAVLEALRRPDERDSRVRRARDTAAALDWTAVTDRYFSLYDRVVEQSAPTRPVTSGRWFQRRRAQGLALGPEPSPVDPQADGIGVGVVDEIARGVPSGR